MTNSPAAILKIISQSYDIPYDDLVSLINNTKKPKKKQNNKKTYEYVCLNNIDFMYDDDTCKLYTYNEENPYESMKLYGHLIPETLEVIKTSSL